MTHGRCTLDNWATFGAIVVGICFFFAGCVVGWFWRSRYDKVGWTMAAKYRKQADDMMDRLIDLEAALMEDDDG